MRKTLCLWLLAGLGLVTLGANLPGCIHPPAGTVAIDITGDGEPDAVAIDADKDGQPDLDPNGNPQIVAGSKEAYARAATIDSVAPGILNAAGLLTAGTGIGAIFGAVGIWWRGAKVGRLVANLVLSIQSGRKALAVEKPDALAVLDKALDDAQKNVPGLRDKIIELKKALKVEPIE